MDQQDNELGNTSSTKSDSFIIVTCLIYISPNRIAHCS